MIDDSRFTLIRRLFFAEHFKIGTIVSQLGVHPDAVRRAIGSDAFNKPKGQLQSPSLLDPYKPFVEATLRQYPRLRATRILEMITDRGYVGGYSALKCFVRDTRPQRITEAYLRLVTLPGEQAQVDWAHFGTLLVGHARRALYLFVLCLSYSRAIFARFFLDQSTSAFLNGHVLAFQSLKGVPRQILYDNLKSAVLERQGDHIRFAPQLLEFCGHYHYQPQPCAPYRGNEKGKVERTIHYLRHSFFAARRFASLDDLNAQLAAWIAQVAHKRQAPCDPEGRSVETLLQLEQPRLLPLPVHPFPTDLVRPVLSGKTPYVRFDQNDYSIPHALVKKPLVLCVSQTDVRITDPSGQIVAHHPRCFGRAQVLEDPLHLSGLTDKKRHAKPLRARQRIERACPVAASFFEALCQHCIGAHKDIGPQVRRLGQLLDIFGPALLNAALQEALSRGALSPQSVEHLIEQRRKNKKLPPPIPLSLPLDPRLKDLRVLPHDLSPYDALTHKKEDVNDPA